ncbi:MerR family transcriptional regulator [Pseudohongiella spirulinae]|uniref:MerR family transcriptional regulator n=1 Tax=Pseudohongiella spirulinae TaxID=1249552 RepID=A0A0S2KBS3_9GAMM|nr:MerR family DNA-binding transcriptional regulator [Pseudohongiella spirulinae]ALO45540.1 MerR family transcriptional regulator [Pseudohongiella spirulinae]
MPDITDVLSDTFLRSNALDPRDTGSRTYTISQLAKEFDITTRAIRFYESEGLLNPEREGRNRLYSQRDHTRLKLILRGKRLGFSLDEIGEMFELYDSPIGELAQLRHVLDKIDERKQILKQQLEDIQLSLHELKEFESQCKHRLRQMRSSH